MSVAPTDAIDSVDAAANGADVEQPWADLGLREEEYARIREILGRRPTRTELAMYAVMWSEHCSYKSSKVHLRQFGAKAPASDRMLVGMGENAGVVDIGDGQAVTFKIESHNHPSFVEPYQGAATGVGGIIRDILTMGARPVAVMDALRFGDADAPDTARVLPGIVAGVAGYGNCMGLPNIGGELVFDPSYAGNPLVNALCVGVLPADRIQLSAARGAGNQVILLGALTGRDGIGGVSVLASATFADDGPARRPSVQVGDPFAEKTLTECCLELFERDLVAGIQDLGGAGLTCATTETAAAGTSGMHVELDRVPLREASMPPHEILSSESQERMLAIVTPENVDAVLALARRWGVVATVIGEVTDGDRLIITWHGEIVVDVPPASLADEGPIYTRPIERPADQDALITDSSSRLPRPSGAAELRATLLRLLASPNLCDKTWVTEQYDRHVQGNTVLAQPENAGMVRVDECSHRGIALATDGNGRYARLDPYAGAQLALAEAYRNVAVTGATPIALTNCLNFGSPEDPGVMWQFREAVTGLADGAATLGTPVTGGNVSFYNQTGHTPINPTPVIGVLGLIEDVRARVPMAAVAEGDLLLLLGETRDELDGSEWAWVVHRHLGGTPPRVDLEHEARLAQLLAAAAADGVLRAAHDLSDGGLGQALAEICLRSRGGARVRLPGGLDPFVALCAESSGRVLVTLAPEQVDAFAQSCADSGVDSVRLGWGSGPGEPLLVEDLFEIELDELDIAYRGTLPALFD